MKYICINPLPSNKSICVGMIYRVKKVGISTIPPYVTDKNEWYTISSIDDVFGDQLYYGIDLCTISKGKLKDCFRSLREYNLDKIL